MLYNSIMKICKSQHLRMTLEGSKHVVEHKSINYSCVDGGICIIRCFENVAQFKYFRTIINQNLIQEEIKRRLNVGNDYYHSDRTFYLKTKIRIQKTIILPVVLYGCETGSLTLRKEHRLRVFEDSDRESIWTEER
jgi:hypothetical protein